MALTAYTGLWRPSPFSDSVRYVKAVLEKDSDNVAERADVLDAARELFAGHESFADIPDDERKGIAGFLESGGLRWKWFGSMQGAGWYKKTFH